MEKVVERGNLFEALRRVRQNKGSPGVDGMTVDDLRAHLVEHWLAIREQLLSGTYQPKPVRQQEIPKSGGGTRKLGIPTVLDRFIQQAVLQVLQPLFDPTFSEHSYGFRPGRSAHDAIRAARQYIQGGRRYVVDVDLEAFFDRVNHDVLMGRLAKRLGDRRLLGLIRRFLEAGMMANGVVSERREGTPQGGPLSPLLANVLLDEVDRELERRGHAFVRYADDCNVYVRTKRSGVRVMSALRRMYERLHLRVNEAKSAVAGAQTRKFLGVSFWHRSDRTVGIRVAPKAMDAMKNRVRELTSRVCGRDLRSVVFGLAMYLRGWKAYFRIAETRSIFGELDKWIRRRLRAIQLRQWRHGRVVFRELTKRGVLPWIAANTARFIRHWWCFAASRAMSIALPASLFDSLGLPRLAA